MAVENVRHTVEIADHISKGCEHCDYFGGGGLGDGSLSDAINHYITEHGYRLLHVGTQTNHDQDGRPWHNTVAVLGHDNPSRIKPPANIVIGGAPPRV